MSQSTLEKRFFTVKEAQEILGGVSAKTVYRLCDRGILKCSKHIRHKLITKESLNKFFVDANNSN
ncbi:MAG: helix-turn-helix domain-containing protein [Limisphaerales bacterium]